MAHHTFKFLWRRRKDPKWQDAYYAALLKRLLGIVLVLAIILVYGYIQKNDIDVTIFIQSTYYRILNFFKNIFG